MIAEEPNERVIKSITNAVNQSVEEKTLGVNASTLALTGAGLKNLSKQ